MVRYQALVAALAAGLLAGAAAAAPLPTRLAHWSTQGAHVRTHARGYCWTSSIADARADAWRCFRGNEILDPCFTSRAGAVLCPVGTPGSRDALELRLTKPLPRAEANSGRGATPGQPWVIVTSRGDVCYRLTGTIERHAGRPLDYECAGAAVLAGTANRTTPRWTIRLLPTAYAKRFVTVGVRVAWW
jgi:hypothetical protein